MPDKPAIASTTAEGSFKHCMITISSSNSVVHSILAWYIKLQSQDFTNYANFNLSVCLFSVCGVGWVDKAVLFPLMKACFANSMNDRETKTLLASTSLMSLVCLFVGQNQYRVGWNWVSVLPTTELC